MKISASKMHTAMRRAAGNTAEAMVKMQEINSTGKFRSVGLEFAKIPST